MNQALYRTWLESEKYQANTVNAQLYRIGRVAEAYGDLDQLYAADGLAGVRADLVYSVDDAQSGKPNPSKLVFTGDVHGNLAAYRGAVDRFIRFKQDVRRMQPADASPSAPVAESVEADIKQRFSLERDMQLSLRQRIEQLESGLTITDDGAERGVDSGYIDILAEDANGTTVVIELKAGLADRKAVAQIIGYMGDLMHEQGNRKVRGILIAERFHANARAAAMVVPGLQLKAYSIAFSFSEGGKTHEEGQA